MLSRFIVLSLCHLIDSAAALPGISTDHLILDTLIISLFKTKATPAELLGHEGSWKLRTSGVSRIVTQFVIHYH